MQTFTYVPDGVALERLVLEDVGRTAGTSFAASLVDSFEAPSARASRRNVCEGCEHLDEVFAG